MTDGGLKKLSRSRYVLHVISSWSSLDSRWLSETDNVVEQFNVDLPFIHSFAPHFNFFNCLIDFDSLTICMSIEGVGVLSKQDLTQVDRHIVCLEQSKK